MSELPAGLADPLHLTNPYPYYGLIGALALLALLTLLTALLRRRRRAVPRAAPAGGPPVDTRSGVFKALDELRQRFLESQDYRRGCHELSTLLRTHLGSRSGRHIATLTAREMPGALGDGGVTRFFQLLAGLQFRRREPTREEFRNACDLALAVTTVELPR